MTCAGMTRESRRVVLRNIRRTIGYAAAALVGLQVPSAWGGDEIAARWGNAQPRFVVYYGTADQPALGNYDVVVLDSDIDATIVEKYRRTGLLLGYLSLAEVHSSRPYATELLTQGLLIRPNDRWNGTYYVDMRDPRWRARVLDQLVPEILQRGFAGLFLDTLDDAPFLESQEPLRYKGMTAAAAELVHALRERFPAIVLMVNRGYELLPAIVSDIDMLMGESVHSFYDFHASAYVRVGEDVLRWQRDRLQAARRRRPELLLFALDYWTPTDPAGISALYLDSRADGFIPYVATIDLTRIVPKP